MTTIGSNTLWLSTAFLGTIEYFYYLNRANVVIVEQHETWPKQTYRNRTFIVNDKGVLPLVIPVKKSNGNHTKTKDVVVLYNEKTLVKHWRSIETAYQNSPYFLYYADAIKDAFYSHIQNLLELNTLLTRTVCDMIGIKTEIQFSRSFVKTPPENISDLRFKLSPKLPLTIAVFPEYVQVFIDKQPFVPNAGILDLLFCLGPETKNYLDKLVAD